MEEICRQYGAKPTGVQAEAHIGVIVKRIGFGGRQQVFRFLRGIDPCKRWTGAKPS